MAKIIPKQYQPVEQIKSGIYDTYMHCGYVDHISDSNQLCERYENNCKEWAEALNNHIVR